MMTIAIIIVVLVAIALAILVIVGDCKYTLYVENKTGIGYEYIGKGKVTNNTYCILRSTKDTELILVPEEDLQEEFHK